MSMKRLRIQVSGQVQGVGFRPFVYRTATAAGLSGHVGNTPEGVVICVQGPDSNVADFARAVQENPPPLARITDYAAHEIPLVPAEKNFCILESPAHGGGHAVLVSPDVATCEACLTELFDPADRRYLYPFINCTDCGPRYTITRAVPYDRVRTSMACFPLCPACGAEYTNPADRRFHAEPVACSVCGPQVWLVSQTQNSQVRLVSQTQNSQVRLVASQTQNSHLRLTENPDSTHPESANVPANDEALREAARRLAQGGIVALRGLGGFHLACDARNPEAIARLRERKHRPHKALAVMVADLNAARTLADLNEAEARLLADAARPIVLVQRKPDALPRSLAPDTDTVGLMLAYTPLHHVLLHHCATYADPPALVMTSGNPPSEPLCLGNREALARLSTHADAFVLHNRDILIRADDSVARVIDGAPLFIRRSRGYTPSPLPLPRTGASAANAPALAFGADLKAAPALSRGNLAFVSQYIGDLEHPSVTAYFESAVQHLMALLEVWPTALVADTHPGYHSTRLAEAFAAEHSLPLYRVQHHEAHLFAVLGEHQHEGPALGLLLDGTGHGPDGSVWGGELLFTAPGEAVRRIGRLRPFPLPGGDKAVREPWRVAVGLCAAHNLPLPAHLAHLPQTPNITEAVQAGAVPLTSSCGRLFDAVSAAIGLCPVISYEGQAAIRLEAAQQTAPHALPLAPPVPILHSSELLELDSADLFRDCLTGSDPRTLPATAQRFHARLILGLAQMAKLASERTGTTVVALSGGVLQNATMARDLPAALRRLGLTPLLPRALPPGDGAISYGQLCWLRANGG